MVAIFVLSFSFCRRGRQVSNFTQPSMVDSLDYRVKRVLVPPALRPVGVTNAERQHLLRCVSHECLSSIFNLPRQWKISDFGNEAVHFFLLLHSV
jgi:hypothetical protein